MSIRNVQTPQIKGWLDAKFHDVNARVIDLESTDEMVTFAGAILSLNGSAGSVGEILKKDGSNIVSWETDTQILGSYEQSQLTYESTTFTTASATPVAVATFTTASLTAGEYLLHYSVEAKNSASEVSVSVTHDTGGPTNIQDWMLDNGMDEYQTCTGFKQLNLTGVNVFTMYTYAVTTGTNTLERARFQMYRLS